MQKPLGLIEAILEYFNSIRHCVHNVMLKQFKTPSGIKSSETKALKNSDVQ